LKRKGGTNSRELTDLKYQVNDQKSKLAELCSENAELQTHNRKLQEMLKGEQQVNSSTMDCIKKELEYTTQELEIQRGQATNQKAEFEKEIERLLFDNREIKEQSRKTQRELSREITSLTEELKDERDRIHELQKENRKLRQENIELQTKLTKLENTRGRIRPENVTDTGTQVEDKSFTRKKAFDFYIDEVQRDANKLLAKGREMEREVSNKAKEAEKRVVSPDSHVRSPPPTRKTSHGEPTSRANEPPSATSTFKRRFSFKRLTMTSKNKSSQ
jgi:regulator of replication initiation timing